MSDPIPRGRARRLILLPLLLALLSTVTWLGARESQTPYLIALSGGYEIQPLLTVGQEVPMLGAPPGRRFALAGLPDGLGVIAHETGYDLYVNHEIGVGTTTRIAAGEPGQIRGARVSLFRFDPNWQPVGGRNLVEQIQDGETVYTLDLTSGEYRDEAGNTRLLSRLCSGTLAMEGFQDGGGNQGPLWFTAEESGPSGLGWAIFPDGTALALHGLGRYSKEQVLPATHYPDLTLLLSTEDTADGELYLYVGARTPTDPNGLHEGVLHVLRVEDAGGAGLDYETLPLGAALTGRWTPLPAPVTQGSGGGLSAWVNDQGRSTNFRRLEDIAADPTHPGRYYFATTGHDAVPPGAAEPDNPLGNLYRLTLDSTDPTAPAIVERLLAGGPTTGVNYDNLAVDALGAVWIQEDRAGAGGALMAAQERHARVLRFNPVTGETIMLFETNQAAIDPTVAEDWGNWESSGIITIQGKSSAPALLLDVQAHSLPDPDYAQDGQILLVRPLPRRAYTPLFRH